MGQVRRRPVRVRCAELRLHAIFRSARRAARSPHLRVKPARADQRWRDQVRDISRHADGGCADEGRDVF